MQVYSPTAKERAMKMREVLLEAIAGKLSWLQAADILGPSPRTMRRWREKFDESGVSGLLDGRRRTPSDRALPAREILKWLRLYRERYSGYNVRHFHSMAHRKPGASRAASVLRRTAAPRRQPCESTHTVMTALAAVITRHGIPAALHSDRASWAAHAPRKGEAVDKKVITQVGRALRRLGVEYILGYSPRARGRGERANRTIQDRLVNELRTARIATTSRANRYLIGPPAVHRPPSQSAQAR